MSVIGLLLEEAGIEQMVATMKLSLNQMRALEAVVRTGSFSAAAKELGISQPSVSNHLSTLEKHYNVHLIHRFGRNAEPTDACRELLPRIRVVLSMSEEIEQALEGRVRLQRGALRLGYTAFQFAMPVLSDFMAQFPKVDVEAHSMASDDCLPLLQDGTIDVAFITVAEAPSGLHALSLGTDQIVMVAPPDHPISKKKSVSWDDLSRYAFIQRDPGSQTGRLFEGAASQAGIQPKTLLTLGSWGAVVASLHAGMGVGVAMRGEITPSDQLVAVPIGASDLTLTHFLVCLPEMKHSAPVAAIFRAAQDHISRR